MRFRTCLLAVMLVSAACGSAVPPDELRRALGSLTPPSPPPSVAVAPAPADPGGPPGGPEATAAAQPSAGSERPATSRQAEPARRIAAGVRSPGAAGDRPSPVTSPNGVDRPDPAVADATANSSPPAPRAPLTPILVGSVGTLSGPVGAAMEGGPTAVRVWAQAVNDAGGIAGQEVRVAVADDGGDPGRYQALLRDLVEQKGVVAFVSNMAAFTLGAGAAYLEARRVPVIGGDLTSAMWHDSPMFFPQSGGEQAMVWGMVANAAATGKRRFGSFSCRESQGCQNAERYWYDDGWVAEAGMEPAYRAQISIAQPDYTAECLSARNAGVEVLAVVADGATARRVAVSCDRQGYRPIYTISGPTIDDRVAAANTGALEGTLGAMVTFPYVVGDTPATAEFQAAWRRYQAGEGFMASTTQGWVAAKLFERVATAAADPTDPEQLLDALWSLRGETLGGMTAPRTFVRERHNPDLACFFVMRLVGRAWTAPSGTELRCRAG